MREEGDMDGSQAKRWTFGGLAASAALVGALALTGCAAGSVTGGFTISDGSVDVSGASLTVTLECDDATGGDWGQTLSGDGVQFDTMEHKSDEGNPEETADTVDYDVFLYTGKSAGSQEITFTYSPAGDPTSGDTKTVVVKTTTNDSGEFTQVEATDSDGSSGSVK